MSGRDTSSPAEILARYAGGFFPLYDLADRFYWERLSIRAVIPLTSEAAAHAARISHRDARRFEIRYTTSLDPIIAALQNEAIKPRSWVRAEVATIYRSLHRAGLLQTVEAWDRETGTLVGGLVGLVLPGVFVAETMFGTAPGASKMCLCRLVQDAFAAEHKMIDVQTPHHLDENGLPRARHGQTPHPCVRLGEEVITHARFMRWMQAAMRERFSGTLEEWLQVSSGIARLRTEEGASALAVVPREQLEAAWPMLRNNFSGEIAARVDAFLRAG